MYQARRRGGIFMPQHGSWNRRSKIGYRVMFAAREGGAFSLEPFAEGWLEGEASFGRPVDVEIMPDGALLVSDDQAGVIYRIRSEEHTSELQSRENLVCRLLLEKKKEQ